MMPEEIEYDDKGNAFTPTKAMEEQARIELEIQDRLKAAKAHMRKIGELRADYQSYAFSFQVDGICAMLIAMADGDRNDYELWKENSYDQSLYWKPVEDPNSFQNGNSSQEGKE